MSKINELINEPNYVSGDNAQLRADLAQAQADGAAMRDKLAFEVIYYAPAGGFGRPARRCRICGAHSFTEADILHTDACILSSPHPGADLLARHAEEIAAKDSRILELENLLKDKH